MGSREGFFDLEEMPSPYLAGYRLILRTQVPYDLSKISSISATSLLICLAMSLAVKGLSGMALLI